MLLPPVPLFAFLLTTTFDPVKIAKGNCLADNYYGTYGEVSLFIVDSSCHNALETSLPLSVAKIPAPGTHENLFFAQVKGLDESVRTTPYQEELFLSEDSDQQFLSSANPPMLHQTEEYSGYIFSIGHDSLPFVDKLLPRFYKPILIPSSPIPLLPVPSDAVDRVRDLISTLQFDPTTAAIVNNISVPEMRNNIRYLTGEDPKSPIISRHSFSPGSRIAATWLKEKFEHTGARCLLSDFLIGFAPNVICRYPYTVEGAGKVIISAHYDSRGSFGSLRHPGGDDDGSGTVALLAIAQSIANKRVHFKSEVELVAFAGEEQGLFGSKAYARQLRDDNADVILMIQADMLAYHAPGEPPQLGLPDIIGTAEVAQLVANVSSIYSPELTVGFTPACCSDHQSFHEQGFPSTQVFERVGPIADPMYHNSGDISEREGFDFYQLRSIAKVQMATLLHAAGYVIQR